MSGKLKKMPPVQRWFAYTMPTAFCHRCANVGQMDKITSGLRHLVKRQANGSTDVFPALGQRQLASWEDGSIMTIHTTQAFPSYKNN